MLIILKFKCPWCGEKKTVNIVREGAKAEVDLDRYRTCTRCKREREDDAVPGT